MAKVCSCNKKINKKLAEDGVELDGRFAIDFGTGGASYLSPVIAVVWSGKKPSGRQLPAVFSAYCPFCGKKKD